MSWALLVKAAEALVLLILAIVAGAIGLVVAAICIGFALWAVLWFALYISSAARVWRMQGLHPRVRFERATAQFQSGKMSIGAYRDEIVRWEAWRQHAEGWQQTLGYAPKGRPN